MFGTEICDISCIIMSKRLSTKTGISGVWAATVKNYVDSLVALWTTKIADPAAKLPFQIKVAIAVVVFALSLWFVLAPLAPGKQRERKAPAALASAQSVGRPSRSSRSSKSNGNGHEVEKDDTPAPKASKKASKSPAPRSRSTRRSKK